MRRDWEGRFVKSWCHVTAWSRKTARHMGNRCLDTFAWIRSLEGLWRFSLIRQIYSKRHRSWERRAPSLASSPACRIPAASPANGGCLLPPASLACILTTFLCYPRWPAKTLTHRTGSSPPRGRHIPISYNTGRSAEASALEVGKTHEVPGKKSPKPKTARFLRVKGTGYKCTSFGGGLAPPEPCGSRAGRQANRCFTLGTLISPC